MSIDTFYCSIRDSLIFCDVEGRGAAPRRLQRHLQLRQADQFPSPRRAHQSRGKHQRSSPFKTKAPTAQQQYLGFGPVTLLRCCELRLGVASQNYFSVTKIMLHSITLSTIILCNEQGFQPPFADCSGALQGSSTGLGQRRGNTHPHRQYDW